MNSKLTGWWLMRMSKKSIAIFGYKQRLLSIEMKTKKFQHVPTINISIWHMTCDMGHATCNMLHNYKYSLLSLHMKTKVVQNIWHSWFPAFVWHSDIFILLLSDCLSLTRLSTMCAACRSASCPGTRWANGGWRRWTCTSSRTSCRWHSTLVGRRWVFQNSDFIYFVIIQNLD